MPRRRAGDSRGGFSLVEVAVALTVFAVGALAMAGTTAYLVRQVTLSNASSKRTVALASTIERLRAMPYDSVLDGSDTVGDFAVDWTVTPAMRSKDVAILITGPGLTIVPGTGPVMAPDVVDTFGYRVIRP